MSYVTYDETAQVITHTFLGTRISYLETPLLLMAIGVQSICAPVQLITDARPISSQIRAPKLKLKEAAVIGSISRGSSTFN